ncbi:MAG: hypothetical protein Q8O29_13850 [Polaromonas sp.]|uniref:hypothetical protein n=1 Tax=Polaromonas sp. TaxID=1869339 RepID=UPI0027339444|nr:hypothetical protein [Polaromonas sp.]MDP2819324.1 hypothetical protein [Polaromonas sp.]
MAETHYPPGRKRALAVLASMLAQRESVKQERNLPPALDGRAQTAIEFIAMFAG